MSKHGIVLVALYRYRNFPIRIMHSLLKDTGGVEPSAIARFSVFGDSPISRLSLEFLNLKSVVLGRLLGIGGLVSRRPAYVGSINALGYIFKGDLKTVYSKIKKRL